MKGSSACLGRVRMCAYGRSRVFVHGEREGVWSSVCAWGEVGCVHMEGVEYACMGRGCVHMEGVECA